MDLGPAARPVLPLHRSQSVLRGQLLRIGVDHVESRRRNHVRHRIALGGPELLSALLVGPVAGEGVPGEQKDDGMKADVLEAAASSSAKSMQVPRPPLRTSEGARNLCEYSVNVGGGSMYFSAKSCCSAYQMARV